MNILLTSVGRRSYLVDYFREALMGGGHIHVGNSTAISPAFSRADYSVVTPLIYDEAYIPFLKTYCLQHRIDVILPLFDVDLPILAKHKDEFETIGVRVVVSDENVIRICNDKWNTYCFLKENGFHMPQTFLTIASAIHAVEAGTLCYPLFVKPRFGMGSIGVLRADNAAELNVIYGKVWNAIRDSYLKYESEKDIEQAVLIQEALSGQEYGLDVINDLHGKYQNTIVKRKIAMRAGETDCAVTEKNAQMEAVGYALSEKLGHIANLDVDVFYNGKDAFVLELNARFGGGYPFSHLAGVNLPRAIIDWLEGRETDAGNLSYQVGVCGHKDISIRRI